MNPIDHAKACEPLIALLQSHLEQASKQLLTMRAAIISGNFATANIDAQEINKLVRLMEYPAQHLRGHTLEAALLARGDSRG